METATPSGLESGGYNIFTAILLSRNPMGNFGGYQPKFFIRPLETFCVFCHLIPREPYRVVCGHIFCHDCLFQHILSQEQVCVQCNHQLKKEGCIPDSALAAHIAQSPVRCPYHRGCQWVGCIDDVPAHFSKCRSVAPLLRSWMQSIQAHISAAAAETELMETRVARLTQQVQQMETKCDAVGYEHERQLGWIGSQLDYLNQEVLGSPSRHGFTNRPLFGVNPPAPTPPPPPQAPTANPNRVSKSRYGFEIDECELTESLLSDLQGPPVTEMRVGSNAPPGREVRFSNYEEFVRQDTGDLEIPFATMDDAVFPENAPFHPDQALPFEPAFNKQCLYCHRINLEDARNCINCNRIL